jgi:hypothetical protein
VGDRSRYRNSIRRYKLYLFETTTTKGNHMPSFKPLGGSAVGGDVEELKSFATHLTSKSLPDIEAVFTQIDQKIGQTTWSGADAVAFSGDWDQQKVTIMNQLKSALEGISQKATQQAQAQSDVSAA